MDMLPIWSIYGLTVIFTLLAFSLFFGLYAVTFLAMLLVGMQSSYGPRQNILALVVLALVFAVVMLLIVDLDRAREGTLQVSQQAMIDLQRQLYTLAP